MSSKILLRAFLLLVTAAHLVLAIDNSSAAADGYKQFVDSERRFTFDYPATMKVNSPNADEVKISHPGATLRIMIFVEKRQRKTSPKADALLNALKRKLKEEMKDSSLLEEGKLPGLEGSQGYVICSFMDSRGIRLVQLVQYYVTEEHLLQMIISDRPEGFKNLEGVIRKVHHSLKILNPKLK